MCVKKIILLIDDDEDEFEIFIEALHAGHCTCDCMFANSSEQALNLLCYTVPDFIFIDYNMPKTNGLKCLTKIKQLNNQKHVPVFLYSTGLTDELCKLAISLGAESCISKPYDFPSLARILHQVVTSDRKN